MITSCTRVFWTVESHFLKTSTKTVFRRRLNHLIAHLKCSNTAVCVISAGWHRSTGLPKRWSSRNQETSATSFGISTVSLRLIKGSKAIKKNKTDDQWHEREALQLQEPWHTGEGWEIKQTGVRGGGCHNAVLGSHWRIGELGGTLGTN